MPTRLTVRVWTCRVPQGSSAPEYGGLPMRFPIDAAELVTTIGAGAALDITAGTAATIKAVGFLSLGKAPTAPCNNLPACIFSGAVHGTCLDVLV